MALLCSIILLVVEICSLHILFIKNPGHEVSFDIQTIYHHCYNICTIVFFIFIFFFPEKFGFTAFIAFGYAISIIPFYPENYMGILMYFLGTSILYARGFIKKHQKTKLCILTLIIVLLLLTQIRFGFLYFFEQFLSQIECILIIGLLVFFLRSYYSSNLIYQDKKLNIASFSKLNKRDCIILQKIQKGLKYTAIASEENISVGTLKNRLHFVFEIMETGDKQGFLSYYDDWELYYNPSEI